MIPIRRTLFTACFCVLSLFCLCQEFTSKKLITRYYDYNWKETISQYASYYSVATLLDSGWYRGDYYASNKKPQMIGLYEDADNKIANGFFRYYYPDGALKSIITYQHNYKEGPAMEYYPDGLLKDSAVYHDGKKTGMSAGWFHNGNPSYELKMDTREMACILHGTIMGSHLQQANT
jgi:antitoxin component YwqK of YwqJK toxin-antitoxin module